MNGQLCIPVDFVYPLVPASTHEGWGGGDAGVGRTEWGWVKGAETDAEKEGKSGLGKEFWQKQHSSDPNPQ